MADIFDGAAQMYRGGSLKQCPRIGRKTLAGGLLLLMGCTSISGQCTREVTVKTQCDKDGTAITVPTGQ